MVVIRSRYKGAQGKKVAISKPKRKTLDFTPVLYHLSSVGPKQLCALAHLGCTREAGTS